MYYYSRNSEAKYFAIQDAIKYLCKTLFKAEDRHKAELLHSLHVGFRLIDYGYPVDLVIAGFLHEELEEGEKNKDLKKIFGKKVYGLIFANTKNPLIKGWEKRYVELMARVAAYGKEALIIRAADILDNLSYKFYGLGRRKMIVLGREILKYIDNSEPLFVDLKKEYRKYCQ